MTETRGITKIGTPGALTRPSPESLADVLERVLDKGVVIVGDVGISILDIELLTLKIRLLVASVETAREMGINWWMADPFLNSDAAKADRETRELRERVGELERQLEERSPAPHDGSAAATRARSSK
jgi:gas vesicle protein GvpA/GvpJ/GvpM family